MADQLWEGHQRREVVAGAVQQDLLHVGTVQTREGRLDPRLALEESVDMPTADRLV